MIWDTAVYGVTLLRGNLCTGFVKAASWSLTDGKESHLLVAFSETCLHMYRMDSIWNTATELSLTHADDILAWKYKQAFQRYLSWLTHIDQKSTSEMC